jgi:transposase-like protein
MYLWRAVDDEGEGEVPDVLVQERRNKHVALKLFRRLLRKTGIHPDAIVTDKLASRRVAMKVLSLQDRQALRVYVGRASIRSGNCHRHPIQMMARRPIN